MKPWRPLPTIRVKALGLHWRNARLLVHEVHDDRGHLKGVRPLGGSVEFGESAHDAVVREFKEELNIQIVAHPAPMIMENIYEHEGSPGHEILFLFEVTFPPAAFEGQERIVFHEDNGDACVAAWYDLKELDLPGGPELYPKGLKARLCSLPSDATRLAPTHDGA